MITRTRTYPCPNCCPAPGRSTWDRAIDDDNNPVWKCRNCWHTIPIRTAPPSGFDEDFVATTDDDPRLTARQRAAIRALRAAVDVRVATEINASEVKQWTVTASKYFAVVVFEIGMVADEGTAAAIFCRDFRQIFVGLGGGFTLANPAMWNEAAKRYEPCRTIEVHGLHNVLRHPAGW